MNSSDHDAPLGLHAHRVVFSSQRTIYVCLYDCDNANLVDLDHRVNSVAKFAPGAPVILVGMKSDEITKSSSVQLEAALLSRYKRLRVVRPLSI